MREKEQFIELVNGTKLTEEQLLAQNTQSFPYIFTLLWTKQLNPENVPEEFLSLKNALGQSVLDVCLERFRSDMRYNEYGEKRLRIFSLTKKRPNENTCTLPLYFMLIKEVLTIYNEDNWLVAHSLAENRFLPEQMMTRDILERCDRYGYSVAYAAATGRILPSSARLDPDILLLGNGQRDYVAHVLARNGELPIKSMTPGILRLKDRDNYTVLDTLIRNRKLTPQILQLPWDDKKRIFELMQDNKFRNTSPAIYYLDYIDAVLKNFYIYQTKYDCIVPLSNDLEMER